MAWTYSDWHSQTTLSGRLTRLRLHMAEVANQIAVEIAGDGKSRGSSSVQNYYDTLVGQLAALEKRSERVTAADGASGMWSQVRFPRPE